MSVLRLVSQENVTVECPLEAWMEHSEFVRNAFDDSDDESIEINELPVPIVKEKYIHLINSFFEIYQEEPYLPIPRPLPKNTMVLDFIQRRWSKWLIGLSFVMELILCCNFLQLDVLKQLLCAYIAGILQNVHRKNYGIIGLNNPENEEKGQEDDEDYDEKVFHNPLELRKEQILNDLPYFDFRESNGWNFNETYISPELAAEIMKYGEPTVFPKEYII